MKTSFNFRNLFFMSALMALTFSSCKDKDAATETETTETYSTETPMDTVPPVPNEDTQNTMDTTATTPAVTSPATGTGAATPK